MHQQEQISLSLFQFTNVLGWSPQISIHVPRSLREPPLSDSPPSTLVPKSSPFSLLDPSRPGTLRLHSLVVFLRFSCSCPEHFPREKRKFKYVLWNAGLVWQFISWRQRQISQESRFLSSAASFLGGDITQCS